MFSSPRWSHFSKFLQLSVCRWTLPAFSFPVELCQRNKCLVTIITSSSWRQFWRMGRRTRQLPTTKQFYQHVYILFSHLCHLVLVNISQDLSESLLVIFGPDQCASSNHDLASFPVFFCVTSSATCAHATCQMWYYHLSSQPTVSSQAAVPGSSKFSYN